MTCLAPPIAPCFRPGFLWRLTAPSLRPATASRAPRSPLPYPALESLPQPQPPFYLAFPSPEAIWISHPSRTMAELVPLPGVGHKTTNVILGTPSASTKACGGHPRQPPRHPHGLHPGHHPGAHREGPGHPLSPGASDDAEIPADLPRATGLRGREAPVRRVCGVRSLPLGEALTWRTRPWR